MDEDGVKTLSTLHQSYFHPYLKVWPIPNPPTRYTNVVNSSVNMTLQYNPIVKKTVLNF
jgi:hypothetical protein